jgi:hypothetical protein
MSATNTNENDVERRNFHNFHSCFCPKEQKKISCYIPKTLLMKFAMNLIFSIGSFFFLLVKISQEMTLSLSASPNVRMLEVSKCGINNLD